MPASFLPVAATSHVLRYFFTGVSELGHGLPRFVIVGYLDDQQFVHYDSDSRRDLPRGGWIQKVEEDDAQYWDWQTQLSRSWELYFQLSLWNRFNHTPGKCQGDGSLVTGCLAARPPSGVLT